MSYKLPDEELLISKLSASTQKMKHGIVLVAFTPLVDMNTAHHMLTYACATPAFDKPTWFVLVCPKKKKVMEARS